MMTNPLLEAKYQVQKRLDEDARHDIMEYAKNSHRIVGEIEAAYGIQFKYMAVEYAEEQTASTASIA
jgi:hypothetical protein